MRLSLLLWAVQILTRSIIGRYVACTLYLDMFHFQIVLVTLYQRIRNLVYNDELYNLCSALWIHLTGYVGLFKCTYQFVKIPVVSSVCKTCIICYFYQNFIHRTNLKHLIYLLNPWIMFKPIYFLFWIMLVFRVILPFEVIWIYSGSIIHFLKSVVVAWIMMRSLKIFLPLDSLVIYF